MTPTSVVGSGVIGITPTDGRDLSVLLDVAANSGLRAVMIRDSALSQLQLHALVSDFIDRFEDGMILHAKTPGAINVAQRWGLGLHLSSTMSAVSVRSVFSGCLSMSCHGLESLRAAEGEGCDFALLSPVYAPLSKPSQRDCLGLTELRRLSQMVTIPVVALGGITPDRVVDCLSLGASAVAGIGGVFAPGGVAEVADACKQMRSAANTAMKLVPR